MEPTFDELVAVMAEGNRASRAALAVTNAKVLRAAGLGPVTSAIYGEQDVAGFFERASSLEPCSDCDLSLKTCPACWKAGYRGEAPCLCHEVRS